MVAEPVTARIGAVVIGRNEGVRLVRCLVSVQRVVADVVYVDSGSTDDSVVHARSVGAKVVELDMSVPFTAARARNAGAEALARRMAQGDSDGFEAGIDLIQFIDGDCELQPGWVDAAKTFLAEHPEVAVVCGRLRERFPEHSLYNRLCDWEWNTPVGRANSCGGIAMIRAEAFKSAHGFNPALIAGEEPELCVRLRTAGWEIWRIEAEMALHDAAMMRFGQWWRRSRRGGFAAAQGMAMHGRAPERYGVAPTSRALVWGLALPLIILLGALFVTPWALLLALTYPLQVWRLAQREGVALRAAWEHAAFLTLIKFPEALGVLEYAASRLLRAPKRIIEYK